MMQKEKGKGHPPKNWKVLKERRQQIKQKLKKQAEDWMRNAFTNFIEAESL